jgi:hypothetical protein
MTKSSSVAALIALAFAGASLANDPAAPKSGSASPQQPALNAAAQCETLVGDKKEQCMRQAQQGRGTGAATGGTSGSGAAGAAPSAPRGTGATGTEGRSGTARPY